MYCDGGLFNRSTGAHLSPDILNAIVDTSKVEPVVGVQQTPSTPTKFFLGQNYPNPFDPATTIGYQVPTNGHVTIEVYDVLGGEVETLVNETKEPGKYEVKFDSSNLPSGVYFYRMQAGDFSQTEKLLLLK